jgi:3-oxoacyl-[acyl-carrier protein] reductase
VARRFGRIDVLVNNMAMGTDGLLTLLPESDIHHQIALNPECTVFLNRACLKAMFAQRSGSIVNVSSVNALRGYAGVSVYSATKAALIGLTTSLAVETGPAGVRVNCAAPGYFESAMTGGLTAEQRARIVRRTPLKRLGTVDDVVGLVRFLVSTDAAFITGQVIAVDGGWTC